MVTCKSVTFVYVLIVLLALTHIGTCLRCYQCNSITPKGKSCLIKDNNVEANIVSCKEGQNACIKIHKHGEYTRRCGVYKDCKSGDGCSACKKDLCNSSYSIVPSFLLTAFVFLTAAKNIF